MNKAGAWEQWQTEYVEKHYPNDRISDVSKAVGRSASAVSHYASRNGISKNPDAEFRHRSEARIGEGTHNFKGYRRKARKGFYLRYVPWHPNASADGLVAEHRLVMEGLIGRKLTSDEVVHHINGDRGDNRPENLLLMGFGEHTAYHNSSRKYAPRIKIACEDRIISGVEACQLLHVSAKTVSKWYYRLNLTSIEQMKQHMERR